MDVQNESVEEANDFWRDWEVENLTEEEYVSKVLGPKYLPMQMVIPLTLVYVIIFVTGIFGNVATCIVISRNPSMQTTTNYYLFSLAVSDLTLLILGLPNELSVFWQQYPWRLGEGLCKMRAYVSEMSSYVSVLTIAAFSMERYFAICHPLKVYARSGLKRPSRFILLSWLVGMLAAIPFAIYTKVNYVEYPPNSGNYSADSAICAMLLPYMPKYPLYEMSCIVFFLIPMLVILVVYTRMGLRIRSSVRSSLGPAVEGLVHGEARQAQSRKTVVRMLSAVVITFFLCWAPFHGQRLLYIYGQDTDYYPDLNEWLYIFSGCLYYFSTTANPILYSLMSVKYRQAFKETICCGAPKARRCWTLTKSHLRRCDSSNPAHHPSFRCSMRYTFDQAKEMFRYASSTDNTSEDKNATAKSARKVCTLRKEDSTSTPLLDKRHSIARGQTSNESAM